MRPEAARLARVTRARSDMLADQPFFGRLALRMPLQEDPSCTGMWADGVTLGYNPVYVDKLEDVELRGLIAATVFKVVAGHPWRQDSRESRRWNRACALVSHGSVVEAGFRLPADAILDPDFDGMSAEFVYNKLPAEPEEPPAPPAGAEAEANGPEGGGDGDGSEKPDGSESPDGAADGEEDGEGEGEGEGEGTSGGTGSPEGAGSAPRPELISEIRPAPVGEQPTLEEEWKQAVQAASYSQGSLPGGVLQVVDDLQKSRVDWRGFMWSWARASTGGGRYSLSRLNKRYLHLGLMMPSRKSKRVKAMVIVRDSSMSMYQYLALLNGELIDIINTLRPETVYVLDVDAAVQRVQTMLNPDEDSLVRDIAGGGGTSFCPAFEWVEQEGVDVTCMVYLTDLLGTFPEQEPDYPVLWAVPEGSNVGVLPPFGEMVELELD